MRKRAVSTLASLAVLGAGLTFATATPAAAVGESPTRLCGSGYRVIDSHNLTLNRRGTVYLLWNGSSRKNCVVTIAKDASAATALFTAYVQPQGGSKALDSGYYSNYAGPVYASAGGKCIKWGGGIEAAGWFDSGWSHCG
ncbi:acetyltransferase [Streptomyces sp. WAC 06725]|uniref:acetyltransferase n=1 Tax=Streptomyces sp. WAC 06725 TaxID=2203209 RepID=UPI000F7413B1|nr:acetyltransferase [Streptomyces sp. WAC 06725]RSO33822.1 acetyltransferase [Streptomyces sp. WAC 06725]